MKAKKRKEERTRNKMDTTISKAIGKIMTSRRQNQISESYIYYYRTAVLTASKG